MSRAQPSLFEDARMRLDEAIELTAASLVAYGAAHAVWGIAWSGGKDSTATLMTVLHLIEAGRIPAPQRLIVFYADTRMELPPLAIAAMRIMAMLRDRGVDVRVVTAPLDKRFFVYILGRGVPPPSNTFRWCTPHIKVEPMQNALAAEIGRIEGDVLMITGVRVGESAARDERIALSCGKDGAECGQGWYQEVLPNATGIRGRIATLAPLLHWRICHVWDLLMVEAPSWGWPTQIVADAYGQDEATEIAARTGCIGCPLASRDLSLDLVLRLRQWAYLAPLKELKPLYRELREPRHRLKKTGVNIDGSVATAKNKQRMGPLTFDARRMALARVLGIQARCNAAARRLGRPEIDILNAEEVARINELIDAGTWPQGWDGDEPTGDVPMDMIYRDGSVQPLLVR